MKRQEEVYREILFRVIEKNERALTQSELSKRLKISLSIVNSVLKKLDSMGAVKIKQRSFQVLDTDKILYLWASVRNLEEDIFFKARVKASVREIERVLPKVYYTVYTAYKFKFNDVPADYSEVYVYADEKELEEIKKRISDFGFKENSENPNFFVLKKDSSLDLYKETPLSQIFVDLWNVKEWYAKDFLDSLKSKLAQKEK